jgi:prepilin-type processing-associated H-X9-DG protein
MHSHYECLNKGKVMDNWIKCTDRLPEIGRNVLFLDGNATMLSDCNMYIDCIDSNGECFENYLHNYTQWIPLPEPPKE